MTAALKQERTPKAPRQLESVSALSERIGCREVSLGLTLEQVPKEALRCLHCERPTCPGPITSAIIVMARQAMPQI